MAVTHSTTVRNGIADYVVDLCDVGGTGNLVIRATGTVASPGTEIATLAFSATAFGAAGAAVDGRADANTITADTNATGGTAATATLEGGGAAVAAHCAVGTSGSDINLSTLTIGAGATVSMSTLTYTAPA